MRILRSRGWRAGKVFAIRLGVQHGGHAVSTAAGSVGAGVISSLPASILEKSSTSLISCESMSLQFSASAQHVAALITERFPLEQMQHPDDAVHRRADFMADRGRKLPRDSWPTRPLRWPRERHLLALVLIDIQQQADTAPGPSRGVTLVCQHSLVQTGWPPSPARECRPGRVSVDRVR